MATLAKLHNPQWGQDPHTPEAGPRQPRLCDRYLTGEEYKSLIKENPDSLLAALAMPGLFQPDAEDDDQDELDRILEESRRRTLPERATPDQGSF